MARSRQELPSGHHGSAWDSPVLRLLLALGLGLLHHHLKTPGPVLPKAHLEGRPTAAFCMREQLFQLNLGLLWILFHCSYSILLFVTEGAEQRWEARSLCLSPLLLQPIFLKGVTTKMVILNW